jgi:threonine/homoserine/homoserine lactone efflux protein
MAGDLVWLSLSLHGLALSALKIPMLFMIIKWGGVLYLLVLAVRLWRSSSEQKTSAPLRSQSFPVASGFAVTMGNPKAMLFYLSLLPSIVDPNVVTTSMVLALSAAVVVVLSLVFCIYVFFALRARAVLSSHQSSGRMNRLTFIVLAGAAAWVAVK